MTKTRATAIGFVAVLLWSLLALFTVGSAPTPPLLMNALCFTIGGTLGLIWTGLAGGFDRLRAVPPKVFLFGAIGLFGYHALYFSALRLAPAAQAGLIAYLWPLLIVLFSGLLPGEQLRTGHLLGALIGFAGAALIIASGTGSGFQTEYLAGYGLALLCALTWSGYSVLSRRVGDTPTSSVAVFCVITAIASWVLHFALEETVWPQTTIGWLSLVALGLGPVGLAFYVWDIGIKLGDIQLLGTSSYAAPILSTAVLMLTGIAEPTWALAIAAALVTGGALIAARASLSG
ncbi:EamA family transporter [Ruegeria sp. 2205SS24-7]|uniref:aromatic amino acid exporter YddG n=1 Tax=Ruegeria discodermiae TaxID=3064389 RepID=UPI002740E7FE|nr:EamA family transporter [Ruegeria sp. 2205SS24-7]MDP5217473.1 EamA family transporter [Ruegeria sp. 2205SS24-7]